MAKVTVLIPLSPFEANRRWLDACLESVRQQTHPPDEILLIDDMAGVEAIEGARIWRAPWRLGVAHAFNCGVALARNDLVFMACDDDLLEPECLEECLKAWEENDRRDAYYHITLRYMDTDPEVLQDLPAHQALVTKGLWRLTGGFPVEASSGAPDCAFVSILLQHFPERLVPVAKGRPLYNYRQHDATDTASRAPWQGVILETRHLLTQGWQAPRWGRYQ